MTDAEDMLLGRSGGSGSSAGSDTMQPDDWSSGLRRRRLGQPLGRYCLGPLVGSGGAASVYMARLDGPHGFERVLALKLVHEHLLVDRDFVAMFLDEANLASQLQHPNIVHSYELCQDDDCLYLAMEYLQGQPLSRVYRRALEKNQRLPYSLVAWIGARAADALAYAHSATGKDGEPLGLVHRDVSPDNLFICYDGQLKLLDFGIARATRRLAQTNVGQIKGKVRYMAPEYALGHEFDGSLDLFALGATLYESALGRPAFEGDEQAVVHRILLGKVQDPRELQGDFPAALWNVIQGTLRPDPELRLGPAASVARELDAVAGFDAAQGRALLALTMDRLFGAEKAADARDIAELRRLRPSVDERSEHSHVLSGPAQTPKRSLKWLAVAALILLSGLLLLATVLRRTPPARTTLAAHPVAAVAPALPSAEPSRDVDISVLVSPPHLANLEVRIAGELVPAAAAHRRLPRGSLAVPVRVTAPGYRSLELSIVPDLDRSLVLALTPELPAAGSAKTGNGEQRKAAARPAGVIKRYPF